jgi:hypothetical protein
MAKGVRFVDEEGSTGLLNADLVVDSSGRGTPTLSFLQATGRPEPDETEIGVKVGYTTARHRIPSDESRTWKAVLHLPAAPATSRGGLLYPMEDGQWILSLGGRGDETPPGDEAGFLNSARLLRMSPSSTPSAVLSASATSFDIPSQRALDDTSHVSLLSLLAWCRSAMRSAFSIRSTGRE